MVLKRFTLSTDREGMYDITDAIRGFIRENEVTEGVAVVWCPHTTAGITVNENADPDVPRDVMLGLARAFPDSPDFRHAEGNSAAHLKSSAVGCEKCLMISDGDLLLGTWQAVWFCEFDGPRARGYFVKILAG